MRKFMTRGTSRRKMMKKMRSNDALRVSVGHESLRILLRIVFVPNKGHGYFPLFLFHINFLLSRTRSSRLSS